MPKSFIFIIGGLVGFIVGFIIPSLLNWVLTIVCNLLDRITHSGVYYQKENDA